MTEPLVPAPLWRRLAALAIDAAIVLSSIATGIAAFALTMAPAWLRSEPTRNVPDWGLPERLKHPLRRLQRPAWKFAWEQAMLTQQFGRRNRPRPGGRAMRIRVVDAKTGGPISDRSMIVGAVAGKLKGVLTAELYDPAMRRAEEQRKALQPDLDAIRERYREVGGEHGNREQQEIAELYRAAGYNPAASCQRGLIALALSSGIELLWAVASPRGQTLAQRIAGTMTVRA